MNDESVEVTTIGNPLNYITSKIKRYTRHEENLGSNIEGVMLSVGSVPSLFIRTMIVY